MLDRTTPERASAYVEFMADAARLAEAAGLEPWIAVHEVNDGAIVDAVNARLDRPLRIVDEPALVMKGIFGCCHAVVGSRYHALVSTLSQGVPAIGTSWSHKYDALFAEYAHSPYLVAPEGDPTERRLRFEEVLSDKGRDELGDRLARIAARKAGEVEAMWRRVDALTVRA
jgi:colanic acid/amylovoran biosynthesis protein